jgi:hypothetical protein
MHGASREDLPRAPQILSAALIRVLPDGFLLKMFYQWSHVQLDFVAFPVCLKDNLRSCPNKTAVIKMGEYTSVSHACAFWDFSLGIQFYLVLLK